MEGFLPVLLRMTLTGALTILAVLLGRFCLRRAPRKYVCFLWLAVLFRLLCPVTLHVPVSAVPEKLESGRLVEDWTSSYVEEARIINSDMEGYSEAVNAGIPVRIDRSDEPEPPEDTQTAQHAPAAKYDFYVVTAADGVSSPKTIAETWLPVLTWVWLAGAAALLLWSGFKYLYLRFRLREAAKLEKGVFEAEGLSSPFVLGILRPRIYLPWGMAPAERQWVLLHERTHIRRLDPLWKLLGWLTLCLHWFNPFCWLAFSLAMQDMEGACDEAVVRSLDGEARAAYSRLLLALSAGKPLFAATPLGFGEGNVKQRIRAVLRWRKPKWWMAIPATVLIAAVVLLFALGPRSAPEELQWMETPDLWPRRSFFAGEWTELRTGREALWPVADVKGFKKELSALLEESEWKRGYIVDMVGETHYSLFPGLIAWTADGEPWELYLGRSQIWLVRSADAFGYWMGYPVDADGQRDDARLERLMALTERGVPALSLTPAADMSLEELPWGCTPEEALAALPGAEMGNGVLTVSGVEFCGFCADAELTFGQDDKGAFLNGVTLRFTEEKETFADVVRFDLSAVTERLEAVWGKRRTGLLYPWWLRDRSKADPDRLLYWQSEDTFGETLRKSGVTAWMDRQVDPRTLYLDASGRNQAAGRQAAVEENTFTEAEVFQILTRLAPDGTADYGGEEGGMVFRVADPAEEARLKPLFTAWPWVKIEFRDPAEPVTQSPALARPRYHTEEGWTPLSDEEIAAAREALAPIRRREDGSTWVNPVDPCFTSFYTDPRELNFTAFMRYFGIGDPAVTPAAEEDLRALKAAGFPHAGRWQHVEDLATPLTRIPASAVEAALRQYFNIGLGDLKADYRTRCYYLAETDCFYSITSDFGPGTFRPEWGERKDDLVRLWNGQTCLTCRRLADRWIIVSFRNEDAAAQQAWPDEETWPAERRTKYGIAPEYRWVFIPEELNYRYVTEEGETALTIPAGWRYRVEWVQITPEGEIELRAELETMIDSRIQAIILRAEDVIPWTEELSDQTLCPVTIPAGTVYYPCSIGHGDEAEATPADCLDEENASAHGNDMTGAIRALEDGYALVGFSGGMEVWVKHEELKVGLPENDEPGEYTRMLAAGRVKAEELGYPLDVWGAELVWHAGKNYAEGSAYLAAYYPVATGEGTVCVVFNGENAPAEAVLIPPGAADWP